MARCDPVPSYPAGLVRVAVAVLVELFNYRLPPAADLGAIRNNAPTSVDHFAGHHRSPYREEPRALSRALVPAGLVFLEGQTYGAQTEWSP